MKHYFGIPQVCLFFLVWGCGDDDPQRTIVLDDTPVTEFTVSITNAFPNLTFDRPVDFQSPDDSTDRVFVVEQGGLIKVFANDPEVVGTTIFLDLRDRISTNANEQGLLGLAFHPDYANNGLFYVNYTPDAGLSVTSSFMRSADANVADSSSETLLLEIPQPFTNHNGGQLAFGPDGYLYISSGDGGSAGDPGNNAQNTTNLLGAILRIDIDNLANGLPYAIPNGNPFFGSTTDRQEIYAYGLRNPWRMSFDTQTNTLWAGDVGQDAIEEIDLIEAGGNYGWKLFEGNTCFSGDCDASELIPPLFEYDQTDGDRSVTGGFVYRGSDIPELQGKYVYGDFISGKIWSLNTDGTDNSLLVGSGLNIASFGTDGQNELYLCAFDGRIYRLQKD
ncbi:MAG: PQQ-dependent sugar dehydrogenase [Flavobacteriaceae bacterium]|nr:PQQ-dependent sugar dehydrogenase [Flavobacteriaceae bacterium]